MARYAQVCRNSPKPKACTQPSHTTLPRVSRFYHSNIATIGDPDLEVLVPLVQTAQLLFTCSCPNTHLIGELMAEGKLMRKSRFSIWTPLTLGELEGFLGIIFNMDVIRLPRLLEDITGSRNSLLDVACKSSNWSSCSWRSSGRSKRTTHPFKNWQMMKQC